VFFVLLSELKTFSHSNPESCGKKRDDEKGMKLDCSTEKENFSFFHVLIKLHFFERLIFRPSLEGVLKFKNIHREAL
jgi:hypothetical protein